jgi:glycerol kinase
VLEETQAALEEVVSSVYGDGHEVLSIGLACQRSSFLLWDRKKGKALTPIISWQDLRAKSLCESLKPHREMIYKKTGLPLTGHYGGPKFLWLLQNDPEIAKMIDQLEVIYSPWNSFLLWHLTEEKVCATDQSVAGRTLFFDIHQRRWDEELCLLFKIPQSILPEIQPTCHFYGHYPFEDKHIPIRSSIGDHQAALLGLGGFEKGYCGINYGTSAGVLVNIGSAPYIVDGLLTNIAYSTRMGTVYTIEGTVNAVGSLFDWFEREQGVPEASKDWEDLMAPSSQGWYLLPGMYGIAAPYWKEAAPTEFVGEGDHPSPEVLLRAGMESIAYLVKDILDRLQSLPDLKIDHITAAGGAARRPLLQFQADLLGVPIRHASIAEATAQGTAFLTGLHTGFWKESQEIQSLFPEEEVFYPQISVSHREKLLNHWHEVLRKGGVLS